LVLFVELLGATGIGWIEVPVPTSSGSESKDAMLPTDCLFKKFGTEGNEIRRNGRWDGIKCCVDEARGVDESTEGKSTSAVGDADASTMEG